MEAMMLADFDRMMEVQHCMREEAQFGDGENLPAESGELFSDLPLNFEEMAAGLQKDLEKVYELTQTLNRYSKDYPAVCRRLEQMIKRLGSCCITKAVMEQKGFEFPALKDLELKDLYCMVSFNFRKTRTAFNDSLRVKNCADMGLLDLECRWVDLAERLKATEEKIRRIRAGEVNVDRMLEQAQMFRGQKGIHRTDPDKPREVSSKARALPVIKSAVREMVEEKKAAEKSMISGPQSGMPLSRLQEARPFTTGVFPPMKIGNLPETQEEAMPEPETSPEDRNLKKNKLPKKTDHSPITDEEIDRMTREFWERVTGTPAPAPKRQLQPERV